MSAPRKLAYATLVTSGAFSPLGAPAQTLATLHSFAWDPDGAFPIAALTAKGETLYGATRLGGNGTGCDGAGCGAVFSINPTTGAEAVLYSFNAGVDGAFPNTKLIYDSGHLVGTTYQGGASGCGTVFDFDTKTRIEKVIYTFLCGADGAYPVGLIENAEMLYGTTQNGGAAGAGTVFTINPATGAKQTLYNFQGGTDGDEPLAGLVYSGVALYGTTEYGGGAGCGGMGSCGTVFMVNALTGVEQVLHRFKGGLDGEGPVAGLVYQGAALYGTTYFGGSYSDGTVFKVNATTGKEKVIYSFGNNLSDGGLPSAGLIFHAGALYGTTSNGGRADCNGGFLCGTVFEINPKTETETVLYRFSGASDGGYPIAGLIYRKGALYGTAEYNGALGYGTVFKIMP